MKAMIVSVACLLACGCGKSGDHAAVAGADTRKAESFLIVATDRGFEAPIRMSAGLRHIVFENRGSKIHEAMLVKLAAGQSADDYVAAVKGGALFPKGALDYSGAGLTGPGESVEVWLRVDAGNFILICWNADHPTTIPVHSFAVVEDGVPDDVVPREDAVLSLLDFRFELDRPLEKGMRVIRIETPGPSMHEVDIFRLHDGSTIADLNRWRKLEDSAKPTDMPAPADEMGGVLDSHDIHRVEWLRRMFVPGRYAFSCEMPAPGGQYQDDHVSHADLGMVQEFEIKP